MGSIREGHIYFLFFFSSKEWQTEYVEAKRTDLWPPPLFALGKHLVVISGKDIQTPFNDNGRQNMMPKPASVTYWIYNAAFNGCEKLFDRLVIQLCQQSSALPEYLSRFNQIVTFEFFGG